MDDVKYRVELANGTRVEYDSNMRVRVIEGGALMVESITYQGTRIVYSASAWMYFKEV